jgi:XTP/dITP diphosphohydrolase
MSRLVLATANPGKLQEFRELLCHLKVELVSSAELGLREPEETGLSFIENALIKARAACAHSGLPAIADDSGLVISALKGAPGLYSARYAGIPAHAGRNLEKVLEEMQEVPEGKRAARFVCVAVFMRHALDPEPVIAQGTWQGSILSSPRGHAGFGYDPIFLEPESGLSAAELPTERKHALSHRGQAVRQLREALRRELGVDTVE